MCEILTEFDLFKLSEIDDEGIERDSEDIDDEKFLDTKELDHILEVSYILWSINKAKCINCSRGRIQLRTSMSSCHM